MASNSVLSVSGTGTSLQGQFPSFTNKFGESTAILYAFAGWLYDTSRKQVILCNGGHNDYNGNEVQAYDLYGNQTFTRIKNPSTPVASSPGSYTDVCADGAPNSFHSYSIPSYDIANDAYVYLGLGSVFETNGGQSQRIRVFRRSTLTWDSYASHPDLLGQIQGSAAAYDSSSATHFMKPGQTTADLERYNVATGTRTSLDDGLGLMNIHFCMACKPGSYLIAMGGSSNLGPLDNGSADMILWDLGSISGGTITAYVRSFSWPSALRADKLGICYCPWNGKFYVLGVAGAIYELTPGSPNPFTDAWSQSLKSPTGDSMPSAPHGVFNRWSACPYPNDSTRGVLTTMLTNSSSPFNPTNILHYKP